MEWAPDPGSDRIDSRMTADAGTSGRMAAGLMHYRLTRPQVLVLWPLIVVAVIVFGIAQDALLTAIVLCVLIFPAITLMLLVQTRRAMRRFFVPGSVHETSFGPESMTITGPFGSSDIRYALFRSVWATSTVVVLAQRPTKIVNLLPAELVPPEALALLRAAVPAGAARSGRR